MSTSRILNALCIILLSCSIVGIASADLPQNLNPVTGKVYVSGVTFDPEVFFYR